MFEELVQHRFGLAGEGHADIIENYLTYHRGRVLYVGCGLGAAKFRNLANLSEQLIVVDRSEEMLQRAESEASFIGKVKFQVADASDLRFEPGSFDHILALGLFAYIPSVETPRVFAEFWRVCRLHGYLMVTNDPGRCPKATYIHEGKQCGFGLVADEEGYCPAADTKCRYLLVFEKKEPV